MPPAFDTPDLCTRIRTNYLMAPNVPLYHGMPNLPLLITADDIVFAPDFNARLARLMRHVPIPSADVGADMCTADVYMVTLYTGGLIEPIDQARAKLAVLGRGEVRWRDRGINATRVFITRWCYGTQAALFSPRVVTGLRAFLGDALQGKQLPGVEAGTYPDLIILA